MKKLYLTYSLLAMFVALLSFTACGDDEEKKNSSYSSDNIEGVWYTTEDDWVLVITNDMITQYELMHSGTKGYYFNSNSLSWLYTINGNKITLDGEESFAYSLSGNTLKISSEGQVIAYTKFNGTIDQLLDYLNEGFNPEEPPAPDHQTSENMFSNEQDLLQYLAAVYETLSVFEEGQQSIETEQLKGKNFDASSEIVYSAWSNAYASISRVNIMLDALNNNSFNYDKNKYIIELMALRSFIYYQLTVMWGNVPYITEPIVEGSIGRTDKSEILRQLYQALDNIINYFSSDSFELRFDGNAAKILYAEITMALGNYDPAVSVLSNIGSTSDDYLLVKSSGSTSGYLKVYNKNYVTLLQNEFDGNRSSAVRSWYESENVYGVWAALKRLSAARELTGCDEDHLILPIPDREIIMNPMMTQNPGY